MCSTRGPLYRFTSVFHQRSSIQVHQVCSTSILRQVKKKGQFSGKMYLLTLEKWQLNTTIKGQVRLMVSGQHSSIQVHQCVPPEVLYTGLPVCSTSTLRQVKKRRQFPGKMYLLTLKKWQLNTANVQLLNHILKNYK